MLWKINNIIHIPDCYIARRWMNKIEVLEPFKESDFNKVNCKPCIKWMKRQGLSLSKYQRDILNK